MTPHCRFISRPWSRGASVLALMILAGAVSSATGERKFYNDDPIAREPATQDASGAQPWDINLFYDLSYNLFVTQRMTVTPTRAQNINTIDEVPDSHWFINRIGVIDFAEADLVRGPNVGTGPDASRWTLTREKSSGFAPGFTARDAKGETWFVSFDPPANPEGATGAVAVAMRIFWALGYNQVESFLTEVRPDAIDIAPEATMRRPSGPRTPFGRDDLAEVLGRAARRKDGSYRAMAGRMLPGKVLGGFRYAGTRPDDPNDIVPHEHRRELRALRVFGAWTNLTDMKAGNTLDTLIDEGGRKVIKHYLQDVGSTFGMGANGPHDWDEGWEFVYDGDATRRRFLLFGLPLSPWQTVSYEEYPAIGRFEGDRFDPTTWKPRVPTAAYLHMQDDDAFWAAQRVMAFSDAMIRAVVKTGAFTDAAAERHLGDVLIKRRDRIGRAYLPRINPVVSPALDASGVLTFDNAAVSHGVATAPRAYAAAWFTFDNETGTSTPLGESSNPVPRLTAPPSLPGTAGSFVRVDVSATHPDHASWSRPVRAYFRRLADGWRLVGFERLPDTTDTTAGAGTASR